MPVITRWTVVPSDEVQALLNEAAQVVREAAVEETNIIFGASVDGEKNAQRLPYAEDVREAFDAVRRERAAILLPFKEGRSAWRAEQLNLIISGKPPFFGD